MCTCKETDVRESANDCTLASGEGHGSRGETCYATFDGNALSSLAEGTVGLHSLFISACFNEWKETQIILKTSVDRGKSTQVILWLTSSAIQQVAVI
jgi:hypothetical protein